jgi:hypothetical protein
MNSPQMPFHRFEKGDNRIQKSIPTESCSQKQALQRIATDAVRQMDSSDEHCDSADSSIRVRPELDSNVNDVKEMHWEKHNLHMNSTAEGT